MNNSEHPQRSMGVAAAQLSLVRNQKGYLDMSVHMNQTLPCVNVAFALYDIVTILLSQLWDTICMQDL